jgi:hypothetical protein
VGPKPVWALLRREKYLSLSGIEPQFIGHPALSQAPYLLKEEERKEERM